MLSREDAERLLGLALAEFAPEWEVAAPVAEVTFRDRDPWLSGIGTFGATLRHRQTGAIKVLGRRDGSEPASYHRGISYQVLEAYRERNTDPVWRYFREVCIADCAPRPRLQPLRLGARVAG
jgi:hypothetical protein